MTLYRVLEGKHFDKGPDGCDCDACAHNEVETKREVEGKKTGSVHIPRYMSHTYKKGDIIDSDQNLLAFNQPPGSMKFEIVDTSGQPVLHKPVKTKKPLPRVDEVDTGDGLEEMTVDELRAMAAEEEIDLGPETRKSSIIKTIRKAMVQQSVEAGFNS